MPLHKGDEMKFKRTLVIIFVIVVAFMIIFLFRAAIARVASVIALAAIFAYLALPLIKILERRTGRTVAALLGIVILISIIIAFITFLLPVLVMQIKDFISFAPTYLSSINNKIIHYVERVPVLYNFLSEIKLDKTVSDKAALFINNISPSGIMNAFSNLFLVPVVVFYFLKEREQLKNICLYTLPGKVRSVSVYIFRDINRQLRDYIIGEFAVIIIVSAMMALTLGLFGFKYWLILGIIMGIFNVIPYVGPFLGSVPIVLTAATEGWDRIIIAVVIILLVQQIDNFIVQPRIISGSVKIHPVIVLLCIVAGNSVGSFIGMVLAIPVYIVLRILFKEFYKYFSERKQKNHDFAKI